MSDIWINFIPWKNDYLFLQFSSNKKVCFGGKPLYSVCCSFKFKAHKLKDFSIFWKLKLLERAKLIEINLFLNRDQSVSHSLTLQTTSYLRNVSHTVAEHVDGHAVTILVLEVGSFVARPLHLRLAVSCKSGNKFVNYNSYLKSESCTLTLEALKIGHSPANTTWSRPKSCLPFSNSWIDSTSSSIKNINAKQHFFFFYYEKINSKTSF